jgi:hypothetical protein
MELHHPRIAAVDAQASESGGRRSVVLTRTDGIDRVGQGFYDTVFGGGVFGGRYFFGGVLGGECLFDRVGLGFYDN